MGLWGGGRVAGFCRAGPQQAAKKGSKSKSPTYSSWVASCCSRASRSYNAQSVADCVSVIVSVFVNCCVRLCECKRERDRRRKRARAGFSLEGKLHLLHNSISIHSRECSSPALVWLSTLKAFAGWLDTGKNTTK